MKTIKDQKYNVIGLMSGTSLDGVDIAYCKFHFKKKSWHFSIRGTQTIAYSKEWKNKLSTAHQLSSESLLKLNSEYGKFLGQLCNQFIKQKKIENIDLISTHGHTIFHQPQNRFTFQLGDGNAIRAITGLPVAFDFRSLDVALGGEGAPLVPVGDHLLFSEYDICLNLGGIANLSMDVKGKRKAFDICFCNMALNYLSAKAGKDFDKNGKLSSHGSIDSGFSNKLDKHYASIRKDRPSLGREKFEKSFQDLFDNKSIALNDRLRTASESIANEIALAIPPSKKKIKLLVTGGGALNGFLIQLIRKKLSKRMKVIVPDKTIIDFKEALVFAFLGVLRLRNEINVLKSVTNAKHNSSSGIVLGTL